MKNNTYPNVYDNILLKLKGKKIFKLKSKNIVKYFHE